MAIITVEKRMTDYLINNGLFPAEAAAVLDSYKSSDLGKAMSGRWLEGCDNYSKQLFSILVVGINSVAREWLAINAPKHWARSMFE